MTNAGKVMKDEGVKITLDKERTLKFDMNALCELEESGMNIEEITDGLLERNFKKIRVILHAVMAHEEDENFTVKKVGALVNLQNIENVIEKLGDALLSAMPESSDDEEKGNEQGK